MHLLRFESDRMAAPQDSMCIWEAVGPETKQMPQYCSPLRKYYCKRKSVWLQLIGGPQKISFCDIALSEK
jgi:hypothetical protein